MEKKISIIVAMSENFIIGNENKLPWHLPADLKYFKSVTLNKPVLMGRKTYESIGKPLPQRRNFILTKEVNYSAIDCEVVHSLEAAFNLLKEEKEIMVIGGGKVYEAAFPYVNRLYITLVHGDFSGDTFFPHFDKKDWQEVSRQDFFSDEKNPYSYTFVIYDRVFK